MRIEKSRSYSAVDGLLYIAHLRRYRSIQCICFFRSLPFCWSAVITDGLAAGFSICIKQRSTGNMVVGPGKQSLQHGRLKFIIPYDQTIAYGQIVQHKNSLIIFIARLNSASNSQYISSIHSISCRSLNFRIYRDYR